MEKRGPKRGTGYRPTLLTAALCGLAAVAAVALAGQGCDEDLLGYEVCNNGKDDDGNFAVDCEDVGCMGHVACASNETGSWRVDR